MSAPTREDDDAILDVLAGRARGLSMGQIARAHHTTRSAVAGTFKRVIDDDIRLSGEPTNTVLAAYERRAGWTAGRPTGGVPHR